MAVASIRFSTTCGPSLDLCLFRFLCLEVQGLQALLCGSTTIFMSADPRPPMFRAPKSRTLHSMSQAPLRKLETASDVPSDASDADEATMPSGGGKTGTVCCSCSNRTRKRCGNPACTHRSCVRCLRLVPWFHRELCPQCLNVTLRSHNASNQASGSRSRSPQPRASAQPHDLLKRTRGDLIPQPRCSTSSAA